MFNIKIENDGEVMLYGRFDAAQAEKAESMLMKIDSPTTIDFTHLEYISSAGLSVLISTYKRLQQQGHSIKLTNMSKHVRDIFHYSRLDRIFEIE